MGRVEENRIFKTKLEKLLKDDSVVIANATNSEFMKCSYLCSIAHYLEDISSSLAVIADSMQQKENED